MMGALEAMDGMLLFGISTAFVFAVMQGFWSVATQHAYWRRPPPTGPSHSSV
jgi:hypothetical protein